VRAIARNICHRPATGDQPLSDYLKQHSIPGIYGSIDTRASPAKSALLEPCGGISTEILDEAELEQDNSRSQHG